MCSWKLWRANHIMGQTTNEKTYLGVPRWWWRMETKMASSSAGSWPSLLYELCILMARVPQNFLLAACMHNGFQIVSSNLGSLLTTHAHYTKHESLAYGVDWWYCKKSSAKYHTVGSCSFYDKKFHLWRCTIWGYWVKSEILLLYRQPKDHCQAFYTNLIA